VFHSFPRTLGMGLRIPSKEGDNAETLRTWRNAEFGKKKI
jgi:hypothetical protein